MLLIDKFAYINRLKKIHPAEKMFLSFFLLVFTITVKDLMVSIITFIVMSSLTIFAAKIPFRNYVQLLLLPVFFLISSTISILFSFARKDLILPSFIWRIELGKWQIFITENNASTVISLVFIVLSSISCLYFLTLTTPFHGIFQILRKLRMPQLLIEIIEITYRFIFVFLESALTIYRAQHSRLGYQSIKQSIHSLALLTASLFVTVFHRTKELTVAMNSRCIGEEVIYSDDSYKLSLRSWFVILGIISLIVMVYFKFGGTL